jgi:hypothetical protein
MTQNRKIAGTLTRDPGVKESGAGLDRLYFAIAKDRDGLFQTSKWVVAESEK